MTRTRPYNAAEVSALPSDRATHEPSPTVSAVPVGIPSADDYTTIVVRHANKEAARAFIKFAHATWPFLDDSAVTQMTAISDGDCMSTSDAMRTALECENLAPSERIELALDLEANCYTWSECLAYAQSEWGLALVEGRFVESDAP